MTRLPSINRKYSNSSLQQSLLFLLVVLVVKHLNLKQPWLVKARFSRKQYLLCHLLLFSAAVYLTIGHLLVRISPFLFHMISLTMFLNRYSLSFSIFRLDSMQKFMFLNILYSVINYLIATNTPGYHVYFNKPYVNWVQQTLKSLL